MLQHLGMHTGSLTPAYFSQAVFCIQQAVVHAAAYGLLGAGATHGALRAALSVGTPLPDQLGRSLRMGHHTLPLGIGLAAACIGLKHGVENGVLAIEERSRELAMLQSNAKQRARDASTP